MPRKVAVLKEMPTEGTAAAKIEPATGTDTDTLQQDGQQPLLGTVRRLFSSDQEGSGEMAQSMLQRGLMMTTESQPRLIQAAATLSATGTRAVLPMIVEPEEQTRKMAELEEALRDRDMRLRILEQRFQALLTAEPRRREAREDACSELSIEHEPLQEPPAAVSMMSPWHASMPVDRSGSGERSTVGEALAQLRAAPVGEPMPEFNPTTCQFARVAIEGFHFDAREATNARQRRQNFRSASEVKDIQKFRTRDAAQLETFLESVIRVVNHWDVQPGDWGRVLLYYLDSTVARAVRLADPSPVSFGQLVRYLRSTYPVGGAIESARIVQFRTVIQGTRSVSEFFEELRRYNDEAPEEFTEKEVLRQFVNNLQQGIRTEVRKEYDRDIRGAKLLPLYQLALGVELRQQQDKQGEQREKGSTKPFGSWYGKPREKAVAAAVAPTPVGKGLATSWTPSTCFNCGSPKHRMAQCRANCENCQQAGHTIRTCGKECPKCGGQRHSHRLCRKPNLGDSQGKGTERGGGLDPDNREVREVSVLIVLPVNTPRRRQLRHRVVIIPMNFQGHDQPLRVGLDTLAATNVMSRHMADTLGIWSARQASSVRLDGVGHRASAGVVTAQLQVFSDSAWEPTDFEILPTLPDPVDLLVGFPWLEAHCTTIRTAPLRVTMAPLGSYSGPSDDASTGSVVDCDM